MKDKTQILAHTIESLKLGKPVDSVVLELLRKLKDNEDNLVVAMYYNELIVLLQLLYTSRRHIAEQLLEELNHA